MNQQLPPIRKTKKSSFKPLSKLNEDNLTELKRVEKPEYTSRVFFYNHSVRAQLQNNVNVWFRDHQHTLALITRQQRAVLKLMGRMQRDRHRVKKLGYQRRQQEIRANMKRLQEELLQRRVIQKFRRNADKKMAARGLKSLASLKLTAQVGTASSSEDGDFAGEDPDLGVKEGVRNPSDVLDSILNYAAIAAPENTAPENTAHSEEGFFKDEVSDNPSTFHLPALLTHSSPGRETSFVRDIPDNAIVGKRGDHEYDDETSGQSSSTQQQQQQQQQRAATPVTPAMKSSTPDATTAQNGETSAPATCTVLESGFTPGRTCLSSAHKPESPPTKTSTHDKTKEKCCGGGRRKQRRPARDETAILSTQQRQTLASQPLALRESLEDSATRPSPTLINTRVVEVKKSRPGSSALVVQTHRRDSLPTTATRRTTPPSLEQTAIPLPQNSVLSTTEPLPLISDSRDKIKTIHKTHNNSQDCAQYKQKTSSANSSQRGTHPSPSSSHTKGDPNPLENNGHQSGPYVFQGKSLPSTKSRDSSSGELTFREGEIVSFRDMVSREQAEEDAKLLLEGRSKERREEEEEEEEEEQPRGGREGKKTLASRVRLERQQAAQRRAKMLDEEPLTQYYRSSRGSLQPLQTQSWRRQFSKPTGRYRYQQGKLLRQEQQKDLERRRHIDQFFTDLSSRRIGQPKQTSTPAEHAEEPQTNHLELLLKRMRRSQQHQHHRGRAASVDWNSVEQLTKCQYLRLLHHGPSGPPEEEEDQGYYGAHNTDRLKITSWSHAESRIRGGGGGIVRSLF